MERSLRLDAIKALDNIRDNLNFSIFRVSDVKHAQSGAIYFKVWNVMNIIMHSIEYESSDEIFNKVKSVINNNTVIL